MDRVRALTATARSTVRARTMNPSLYEVSSTEGKAMNAVCPATATWDSHQLRFASLFHPGRALSFPCNRRGEVDLDELSERDRNNYFLARATVGRDYSAPTVIALESGAVH